MRLNNYKFKKIELENLIYKHDKYYAHLSIDKEYKETLIEHILLVQNYFLKLVVNYNLEPIILKLIKSLTKKNDIEIKKIILEIFVKSIAIHDFGKVNPDFQILKMDNPASKFSHSLISNHSLISGYIFILYFEFLAKKKNICKENELLLDYFIIAFSYPIIKHHSKFLGNISNEIFYSEKIEDLKLFIKFFSNLDDIDLIDEINEFVMKNSSEIIYAGKDFIKDHFALFSLLKLNYSLLTAADYYATSHFMNNWNGMYSDFGVLNKELKLKIIENIESTKIYNKKIYSELDNYKFEFSKKKSYKNLNKLRTNLAVEIINEVRNNIEKTLFYIEAPTGSGKTNLSLIALSEFIRKDLEQNKNEIKKIFYVFPFTTLISQTFTVIKETFDLNSDEIIELHSKAGFCEKETDDQYGIERNNVIDYQFVNYPFVITSHIKFFNILKSNLKHENYLLHTIANSIVIIDELQSYPPKEWDKIVYFINNYSKYYNIKFILMSATLPKIDNLIIKDKFNKIVNKEKFVLLNPNRDKYFFNTNFIDRVTFDFSLLKNSDFNKKERKNFLLNLFNKIVHESKKYKSNNNRCHTIIEFIFKNTAGEFLIIAKEKNEFFDEIYLLSGLILEPKRKEIISNLKNKFKKNINILLITTQVVEAGIDIDMDIGFKDTSLIDSDEQLAGRINRNVQKSGNKLFIFDLDNAKFIYGNDYRFNKLQTLFKEEYQKILIRKKFDLIYNAVIEDRNIFNTSTGVYININDYIKNINKLNFNTINQEFKIINDDIRTATFFVPIDIPVIVPNSDILNFSNEELFFMEKNEAFQKEDKFVSGEAVWKIYVDLMNNREKNFDIIIRKRIILQGLISKFVFSANYFSKAYFDIIKSCNVELKYGYYFLHNVNDIYDYEYGLKELSFEDTNFW